MKCVISSLTREPEKYVRSLRWQEVFQGFRQVGAPGGQEEEPPSSPLWGQERFCGDGSSWGQGLSSHPAIQLSRTEHPHATPERLKGLFTITRES